MSRLIIEAGRAERQYGHDLWRYRELFCFLAWRDLLVRYKQTLAGVAWSPIRITAEQGARLCFGRTTVLGHAGPSALLGEMSC